MHQTGKMAVTREGVIGHKRAVSPKLLEKKVYRLAKSKHWGKGHLATTAETIHDRIHEEMQLVVDYMKNVMQPLLSSNFVVLPELRLIQGDLLHEAEMQIKSSRPAQRKGKDVEHGTVDPTTLSALVMPDLCFLRNDSMQKHNLSSPTLSVEIKPKKAFIHRQDIQLNGSEETSEVCKFCMHQRLKAKEGQWLITSRYCPLDLFSGDRQQMKRALLSLAEIPQNNLRICLDGEEIHGAWNKEDLPEVLKVFFGCTYNGVSNGLHGRHKYLQILFDLVVEALLYVPENVQFTNCDVSASISNQYCYKCFSCQDVQQCSDNNALPTGCVLERIRSTQMLDSLDIDGIFPVYGQLNKLLIESPHLRSKFHLDGPYSSQDWLSACCTNQGDDEDDSQFIKHNVLNSVKEVKRFLISKTVQDCSIMVAFQNIKDNCIVDTSGLHLLDTHGRLLQFSVSIVDLDPKPFCKIPTYHKQDSAIRAAYQEAC